jgi:hypothetical protein
VRVEAVATDKALRRGTSITDTMYEVTYQFALPDGGPSISRPKALEYLSLSAISGAM